MSNNVLRRHNYEKKFSKKTINGLLLSKIFTKKEEKFFPAYSGRRS